VVQIYRQPQLGDRDPVLAAVGSLQFEVLKHRLQTEYKVDIKMRPLPYSHARWVKCDKDFNLNLLNREDSRLVEDRDGLPVLLFRSEWALKWTMDNHQNIEFLQTAPIKRG